MRFFLLRPTSSGSRSWLLSTPYCILYNYNITIFPNKFKNLPNIDILLSKRFIFWFHYKTKPHENRLKVIRNEVINNIPKYDAHPNDLYINIRSGDVFLNKINPMYSQPPLCFYQKIINENGVIISRHFRSLNVNSREYPKTRIKIFSFRKNSYRKGINDKSNKRNNYNEVYKNIIYGFIFSNKNETNYLQ